jgi:hypothetical protein
MTDVDRPPTANQTDDVRRWMRIQYVAVVVWVLALNIAVGLGADLIMVVGLVLVSSLAIWFLVNPRRSWWAPGLRTALADPAIVRWYQLRLSVATVVALVVVAPVTGVVMSALGLSTR